MRILLRFLRILRRCFAKYRLYTQILIRAQRMFLRKVLLDHFNEPTGDRRVLNRHLERLATYVLMNSFGVRER